MGPLRARGAATARERTSGVTELLHQSDPVSSYLLDAPERQPVIRMVVRVGHLAVGHPDDRLGSSTTANRPREDRTVDAVADIPRRTLRGHRSPISEDPDVRGHAVVTGSMTVAKDHSVGRATKEHRQ